MDDLARAGISIKAVTDQLTAEAVKLFADAFDKLLAVIDNRAAKAAPSSSANLTYRLPDISRKPSTRLSPIGRPTTK